MQSYLYGCLAIHCMAPAHPNKQNKLNSYWLKSLYYNKKKPPNFKKKKKPVHSDHHSLQLQLTFTKAS